MLLEAGWLIPYQRTKPPIAPLFVESDIKIASSLACLYRHFCFTM
jgi:hypothetical protein